MKIKELCEAVEKTYKEIYGEEHGLYGYFISGPAVYIILYQGTGGKLVDGLEVVEIVGTQVRKVELNEWRQMTW